VELAEVAGVSAASFVEEMLLELLLHHRAHPGLDAEPTPPEQPGAIPISRGRQRRRGRSDRLYLRPPQ
jgi:hypothetical protein